MSLFDHLDPDAPILDTPARLDPGSAVRTVALQKDQETLRYGIVVPLDGPTTCQRVQSSFDDVVPTRSGPRELRIGTEYERYNGASIPPGILRWVFGHPLHPPFQAPALVHDYLYDTPAAREALYGAEPGRHEVDHLFRHMLRDNGVWSAKRGLMWLGVHLCAADVYNRGVRWSRATSPWHAPP